MEAWCLLILRIVALNVAKRDNWIARSPQIGLKFRKGKCPWAFSLTHLFIISLQFASINGPCQQLHILALSIMSPKWYEGHLFQAGRHITCMILYVSAVIVLNDRTAYRYVRDK